MNEYTSLLFPLGAPDSYISNAVLSQESCAQLELDSLFNMHTSPVGAFFTYDCETILYRQKTFEDFINCPPLCSVLEKLLPYLEDIEDIRKIGRSAEGIGDGYLYSISEIEIYISLMKYLEDSLLPLEKEVKSPAMTSLCKRISKELSEDSFKELCDRIASLSSRVRDIRSITLGINLDRRLSPESAGVISVNSEAFKSGDFFNKIRRLEFKNDEMTFMADLIPYGDNQSENQKTAMTTAAHNAVTDIFKSSVKSWKKAVAAYVSENTDFLVRLIPEIEFICRATALIERLKERNGSLCFAKILTSCDNSFIAKGLYNPVITLKTEGDPVPNDISFDNTAMIHVITGPNRGGKSVLTCAVGHAFAMAQMGLPVCAESLELCPCDTILTHFPQGSEDTVEKGRLGEECARLGKIFDTVTKESLVLLDESLSSTGSFEGAYIASEVLEGFSLAGLRCIFATHLHDLAASVDKINEKCAPKGGSVIDNLVAEVTDGKRSFKILRKTPDGKSYAKDIAEKYGLSIENILEKLNKKA